MSQSGQTSSEDSITTEYGMNNFNRCGSNFHTSVDSVQTASVHFSQSKVMIVCFTGELYFLEGFYNMNLIIHSPIIYPIHHLGGIQELYMVQKHSLGTHGIRGDRSVFLDYSSHSSRGCCCCLETVKDYALKM